MYVRPEAIVHFFPIGQFCDCLSVSVVTTYRSVLWRPIGQYCDGLSVSIVTAYRSVLWRPIGQYCDGLSVSVVMAYHGNNEFNKSYSSLVNTSVLNTFGARKVPIVLLLTG